VNLIGVGSTLGTFSSFQAAPGFQPRWLSTANGSISDFGAFTIHNGTQRGNWLGDEWRQPFWERAAKEFNMPLDETWEDPATESIAESWMRDAAVRIATGSDRDFAWWGGRVYRDFENERASAMLEFAQAVRSLDDQDAAEKRRTRPKRRTRSRTRSKKR